jgi:Ca-activated chloride channel family protein
MQVEKAKLIILLCTAGVMLAATTAAPAQEDPRAGADLVKKGNKLLAEGAYADALAAYDEAVERLPDSPEVAYNRGIALYRLGEFTQAEPAFQDAMRPGRPELEAMAKYNLGRCAHASALQQRENLEAAINDLSRAIRFYRDALQLAPEDQDTQNNEKLARRLKAYLEQRLEQQKKEEPTSQPTSQPDQQPSSQPSSQPTSQPQQGEPQQDQQGEPQQDQQGDQQGRQAQEQQGAEGQQDEKTDSSQDMTGEQEKRKLTPEEAEKFLQEARDMERERREAKRKQALRLRGRVPVKKDW